MSTSIMPMSAEANQELCTIIAANLKTLIKDNGITQRELADQIGIAQATLSDYCSGKRVPQATFFVELRKRFGIDINSFLTSTAYTPSNVRQVAEGSVNSQLRAVYDKYCGTYYTFHLDTSKFRGRDNLSARMSLLYGVLHIYRDPSSFAGLQYNCVAVLGIHKREEADRLVEAFRSAPSPDVIPAEVGEKLANKAYYGDFEISQEHAFINLRHTGTDRALVILHRIENNKPAYIGGIATINSISKGRERMPVVQFFGLSRSRLQLSAEEIQHTLLLNHPAIIVEEEVDELLRLLRTLYIGNDDARTTLSHEQKRAVLRSTLERIIRKYIERNVFRYAKISEADDDFWYHVIKSSSKET